MNQERRSIWTVIVGVGMLVLMIGVIAFFLFAKPDEFFTKELPFADALVTLNEERTHLTVTSADKDSTLLGEWDLPVYWMQADRYGNGVYVLSKGTEQEVIIYEIQLLNEVADLKEKYRFTYNLTDETEITLDEDSITLYEPSTQTFTYVNPEFFKSETLVPADGKTPTAWYSTDDKLYYTVGKDLFVYSWVHVELLSSMSFEDDVLALFEKEDSLYVFNGFGNSSNYTTIFKINPSAMSITELGKVGATEISLFPTSHVSETTFFKGIDARSKKELLMTLNPTKDLNQVDTLTDSILSHPFIFTAYDYLYTLTEEHSVAIYSKHAERAVHTLEGAYAEVYPLWLSTNLEEESTSEQTDEMTEEIMVIE